MNCLNEGRAVLAMKNQGLTDEQISASIDATFGRPEGAGHGHGPGDGHGHGHGGDHAGHAH